MDITQNHIDLIENFNPCVESPLFRLTEDIEIFDPRTEGPMFLDSEDITLGLLAIAHGSVANFTSGKMAIRLGLFQIHSIDGNTDIDALLIPLTKEKIQQLDETNLDLVEVCVTPVDCNCPVRDGFNGNKDPEIYPANDIFCMNVLGNLNLIEEN